MKTIACFLLLLLCFSSCDAQRAERWAMDMDVWLQEVKKQHYVYRQEELPDDFQKQFDKVRSNVDRYSDQRMLVEMLGLSAMLGDGHTYVLPWGAEQVVTMTVPLRFYLFSDGLFVIDAQPGDEKWIGKRVTHIGGISTVDLMKRVERFISRDNEQGVKWIAPVMLPLEGMLQALDVPGEGRYELTFEETGRSIQQSFKVVPFQPVRGVPKLMPAKIAGTPVPLYLQQVGTPYWMRMLKSDKTMYVQFNQVMDDSNESLALFSKRLRDSLTVFAPAKLVVDVRHNNGGTMELLTPLLDALLRFKSEEGNQIFIITGRNTFSAAQIFVNKAEKSVNPIFVGELSSSKPNFVGEENALQLPNSKAICSISNRYHETTPGDRRRWIELHLLITLSSVDYFVGRDPVLEAVLKK